MGNLIDTEGLDQYTDEITTFTSGDSSSPSSFTNIAVVTSKEKPSSLFRKLSQAISNIRYLRNQLSGMDGIKITTNAATPVAASANANNSVAIGYGSNAPFSNSISIGYNGYAKGFNSVSIGYNSASNTNSVSIGYNSASNANAISIGNSSKCVDDFSISIGLNALTNNSASIAIGRNASTDKYGSMAIGYYAAANSNAAIAIGTAYSAGSVDKCEAKASGSIAIGCNAKVDANAGYSVALGYQTKVNTNYTIQLGNSLISTLNCKVQLTVTSDIRDKTDIKPIPNAIDFLNEIEPITYVSNMRSLYEYDYSEKVINEDGSTEIVDNNPYKEYGFTPYDKEEHAKGTKKGERRRSGVSAQNVREAMIKIYGTDNYANLINDDMYDRENVPEEVESHLGVQYECFVPFLIKAIQELDARVRELEGQA